MNETVTGGTYAKRGGITVLRSIALFVSLTSVWLWSGCSTAKITGEKQLGSEPAARPTIVYVADFGLVPEEIQDKKGILEEVPIVSKPARELLYGQKPPTERARELVELMSKTLVKDIDKSGYTAIRYNPETPIPTNGWLVRGMYTKVEEGNKLRRVLIGFGAGKTDVEVVTVFDNLSKGPPQPFYEVGTNARSGDLPGVGPTLVFSPYGAAARFLLAGTDLERNVRETARKIREALMQEINRAP